MQELKIRRKRLRHQCWYRGCTETDQLLGAYADAFVPGAAAEQLDGFEALLAEDDRDIWLWLSAQREVPQNHALLIESIRDFHQKSFA